jgi:DNA-binding Xre family transcriptional regulator
MLSIMNWTKIIQDLLDSGLSEKFIATSCGITQPTLNALKSGKSKSTRYEIGDKLLSLWKVIPKKD